MTILSATPIVAQIKEQLLQTSKSIPTPCLGVVYIGEDSASAIYIRKKKEFLEEIGGKLVIKNFGIDSPQSEIIQHIQEWNQNPDITGIIVQLPIPNSFNKLAILDTILPSKDPDGLTSLSLGYVLQQGLDAPLIPATPLAVLKILEYYKISIESKNITICNNSTLIGRPLIHLTAAMGGTVTLCHKKTPDIAGILSKSDIIITATGQAGFFDKKNLKKDTVVIDVGITRNNAHQITGDFDSSGISQSDFISYTPVPGGVGPVTVACLASNLFSLANL
jgi:methylenetetrahydrofolate dehydrogenase (NADP+)/methenyltetrahydrofolate cyclohydrolase